MLGAGDGTIICFPAYIATSAFRRAFRVLAVIRVERDADAGLRADSGHDHGMLELRHQPASDAVGVTRIGDGNDQAESSPPRRWCRSPAVSAIGAAPPP